MLHKFIQNDNNYAIAYYRFSSAKQDEASIEQQREEAHKYAKKHGYEIIREYEDSARSGTNLNRPQFNKLLDEVSEIKPAALIVWKSDRLGRNVRDITESRGIIRDAGCQIYSITEPIPEDEDISVMVEIVFDGMNELYSRRLSKDVLRGMNSNANKGLYNGVALLGYEGIKGQPYKIDKYMAPVIKDAFHSYAEGESMADICNRLNENGYRTSRGNLFVPNSLRQIFKNEAYIGIYKFNGVEIPDGMPAIVSKEVFNKVQKKLIENKRFGAQNIKGKNDDGAPRYWLTGKLYCGYCHGPMHGSAGTSGTKGKKYYYYSCQEKRKKNGKCSKRDIRADILHDMVSWLISTTILTNGTFRNELAAEIASELIAKKDNQDIIKSLENEQKINDKEINNIIKAISNGASGETINKKLDELEKRRKQIFQIQPYMLQ